MKNNLSRLPLFGLLVCAISIEASTSTLAQQTSMPDTQMAGTNTIQEELAESLSRMSPPEPGNLFTAPQSAADQARTLERVNRAATIRDQAPARIELLSEGAIGRFGAHHVTFPPALPGLITLRTPEGKVLQSRLAAICYVSDTGESLVIAEVKECPGELVNENTILYPDAFDKVAADVLFEYKRYSFEQSVVLREPLPSPSELGFSDPENVRVAVLTEFINPPEPRRAIQEVSLAPHYQALGAQKSTTLFDESLSWGVMRMPGGRSFTLGNPENSVPAGKSWHTVRDESGAARHFLIEATPYDLIKAQLERLPKEGALRPRGNPSKDLNTVLKATKSQVGAPKTSTFLAAKSGAWKAKPGFVLDYIIVETPILNVEFHNRGKAGPAELGYSLWDHWTHCSAGDDPIVLQDLLWSDQSQSSIGILISNAVPTYGWNPACRGPLDEMYAFYFYQTNNGKITVTVTNLPSDQYDVLVYAARASEAGAPLFELKVGAETIWHKGTTRWGAGWMSTAWEEHEQYVRFRDIAVTNQHLTIVAWPDIAGISSISGMQIVPSIAVPPYEPEITSLINCDFGGDPTWKIGPAAVGFTATDYWNWYADAGVYAGGIADLKWSNTNSTGAGLSILNAPGSWSNLLPDMMLRSYLYAANGGNISIAITNLPTGNCDFYLYGHTEGEPHNAIFEIWSGEVCQGIKGTSIKGYGAESNRWEVGQQYVLFKDVPVSSNTPVVIHSKHNASGYNNLSGFQIAYKGEIDSDQDGLPDGWETKWFGNLGQGALDSTETPYDDWISNIREYQLGLDPTRCDTDGDYKWDAEENEFPLVEDAVPQGGYTSSSGGDSWSWQTNWYDGDGWYGATILPQSGAKFHISAKVSNAAHQHAFDRSVAVMRPRTGEVFYAWINLDSAYPPAEIMLQFYVMQSNGSATWDHRAYWGANNLNYGVNGSISRTNMGALPSAGEWVRLEVPASAVGLEGRIVEGIAFTLWGGRAAWDSAGVLNLDMDGDDWLDTIEIELFDSLLQHGHDDYDNDGLPNYLDSDPLVYDTSPPVFTITSPAEGAVYQ